MGQGVETWNPKPLTHSLKRGKILKKVKSIAHPVANSHRRAEKDAQALLHELQVHKIELERKVQERTADLTRTNEALQMEITRRQKTEEALRDGVRKFRAIFDQTFQFIGLLTPDGTILEANQTALNFGRLNYSEVVGRPILGILERVLSPENKVRLQKALADAAAGHFARDEVEILTPEGEVIIIGFTLKPVLNEAGEVVLLIPEGRDITERKRDERRILLINALLEGFVRKTSRKEFLDTVVELLSGWTGCRYGGIRVVDDYGNIPYESYKGFSREFWEAENPLSIQKDQCVCIRVITGRTDPQEASMVTPSGSFWSNNTFKFIEGLSEQERTRYRGTCVQSGFASVAVIPIRYGEKVLGTIHLADDREGKVPLKVVEFIESLTPLIGEAVRRFNLEDQLRWDHETQKVINWIMGLWFKDISLEELLERALERILSIPWLSLKTIGAIFLVEEDPEVLVMKKQIGLPESIREACSRVPFDRCLCGQAARTQEIQFVNPLEECRHDSAGVIHPHGHYCVPMLSEDRVLGVMNLYLQEGYQDDEKKKEFLQTIAKALVSIIERKRAEDVVRESEKQLRTLSAQLLTIQENERKRLAKELHDGVGQTLAAIKFGVENILKQVEKKTARHAAKTLEATVKLSQNAIEEIRKISMDLRPSLLDDLGIVVTIDWFCREVGKIYSGIRFEKKVAIQESEVPDPLKIVIYRVLQEALNNAIQHSGTGVVFLALIKKGSFMELAIEDQGAGFDLDSSRSGLGLASMKERVEFSRGAFAIESTRGKGTVVRATWPL